MTGSTIPHLIADNLAEDVGRQAEHFQSRAHFASEWETAIMAAALRGGVFDFYDLARLAMALDCRVSVTLKPTPRKARPHRKDK